MTIENDAKKETADRLIREGIVIPRDRLSLYKEVLESSKTTKGLNLEVVEDIEGKPLIKIRINFPSTEDLNSYQRSINQEFNRRKRLQTKKKFT